MRMGWDDLTARARGLATHLILGETLESLATTADLPALARRWSELGLPAVEAGVSDPAEFELSARREAARRLRILGRWLGDRASVMAAFFGDEDRRSIRALVRGAVAGMSPGARLSGLIPTPDLPERLLEELSRQESPETVAGLLTAWEHPFGSALLAVAGPVQPDLTRIELALHRAYANHAVRGAKAGGAVLRDYVAETIDLLNAEAGLMLAGGGPEIPPDDAFLEGGRLLTRDAFRRIAGSAGPPEAWRMLVPLFRGTPLAAGFDSAEPPPALEAEVLAARIKAWHRRARLAGVGAAPVIEYLLRLRAQVLQLRTVVWGTALGMPVSSRGHQLLGV